MAVRRRARFEIRRMLPADLDAVMEIERAAFRHPWSTELFRRELEHDWSTILVAIAPAGTWDPGATRSGGRTRSRPARSERIVGFLIYWLVHDEIHILNVATHPEARRKGVGRLLMVECCERGRAAGASLLTLEVRRTNDPALNLYRSLGFRAVGIRPNYYSDEGEDAIVMNLDL